MQSLQWRLSSSQHKSLSLLSLSVRGPLAYYQRSTHGVNRRLTLPTRTTTLRRLQIMSTKITILVTGGSGFVASRCILQALQQGYAVRTTVRSQSRAENVKKMLLRGGATTEQAESVQFTTAHLLGDEGWHEACRGCTYVLHVASPFPPGKAKHEDDLIIPARDGTFVEGAEGGEGGGHCEACGGHELHSVYQLWPL